MYSKRQTIQRDLMNLLPLIFALSNPYTFLTMDYEPDFDYDQDDYIEEDIISQLNESTIRDNLSQETQQLINNFKRK